MESNTNSVSAIATQFARIEEPKATVGTVVLRVPSGSVIFERYILFFDVLNDWKLVCQRYDSDLSQLQIAQAQIKDTFAPGSHPVSPDQRALIERLGFLVGALKLDVRCFYVFAKVPLIAYASLLFAMARHRGENGTGG